MHIRVLPQQRTVFIQRCPFQRNLAETRHRDGKEEKEMISTHSGSPEGRRRVSPPRLQRCVNVTLSPKKSTAHRNVHRKRTPRQAYARRQIVLAQHLLPENRETEDAEQTPCVAQKEGGRKNRVGRTRLQKDSSQREDEISALQHQKPPRQKTHQTLILFDIMYIGRFFLSSKTLSG